MVCPFFFNLCTDFFCSLRILHYFALFFACVLAHIDTLAHKNMHSRAHARLYQIVSPLNFDVFVDKAPREKKKGTSAHFHKVPGRACFACLRAGVCVRVCVYVCG